MAWIRQLPSGKWAATVYTPAGRRTRSHRLKGVVTRWAAEQEEAVRQGDWIDPKLGEITVGEWWERAKHGRGHREQASIRRDESHWRNHVAPRWARVKLAAILKPDVATWVAEMQQAGVGAATIHGAVHVLRSLLEVAVDARVIRANPARNVRLPRLPVHVDRVLTPDEERALLARLDELFPGRVDARLFVELLLDSGVRWEEAAALTRDVWDLRRGRFQVAAVMESDGMLRPYGKRDASNRWCAVGPDLWSRLRPVVMATAPGELVFRAPHGGRLIYSNWLRRVWKRALTVEVPVPPAPRRPGVPGPAPRSVRLVPYLDDPQPTPHDCRHTFGTRLAEQGVPQHEIAALMGHADERSTRRYIHAGEDRFERARLALERARNSQTTHDLRRRSEKAGF